VSAGKHHSGLVGKKVRTSVQGAKAQGPGMSVTQNLRLLIFKASVTVGMPVDLETVCEGPVFSNKLQS